MTAALTKSDSLYPGYVNVTASPDGGVSISVRAAPTKRAGVHVCGSPRNKGEPGRCTPGDDHCNNYCNRAPEKGPMQDSPLPAEITNCGSYATLALTAAEWSEFKKHLP